MAYISANPDVALPFKKGVFTVAFFTLNIKSLLLVTFLSVTSPLLIVASKSLATPAFRPVSFVTLKLPLTVPLWSLRKKLLAGTVAPLTIMLSAAVALPWNPLLARSVDKFSPGFIVENPVTAVVNDDSLLYNAINILSTYIFNTT